MVYIRDSWSGFVMGDRQAATLARPATAFHCRTESSREFAANATLAAVGLPATVSANERDEPRLGAARTACATRVAAAEAQTYLPRVTGFEELNMLFLPMRS